MFCTSAEGCAISVDIYRCFVKSGKFNDVKSFFPVKSFKNVLGVLFFHNFLIDIHSFIRFLKITLAMFWCTVCFVMNNKILSFALIQCCN